MHSDWVAADFGRKRCSRFAMVIIMLLLGAVIGTSVVAVVGDYFARVVYSLHLP